ncbi:MAG: PD-(D/E)XK nuclease family protein [Acidobacteriota bacterium]
MPARFIAHPEPRRLLEWLREDLESRVGGETPHRSHVLVPNKRLASHLRRRLTESGGAFLGLRVINLWTLVSELAARASGPVARLAPRPLLRQEVHACLRMQGGRLADAAKRRPGLSSALLATFGEMREAEVGTQEVNRLLTGAGGDSARETLRLYGHYLSALRNLEGGGWLDRAGFVQRALPQATAWARKAGFVYLYGAYELIGVHLSLLRALEKHTKLTVLLPLDVHKRPWSYGTRFAHEFLLGKDETIEALKVPPLGCGAKAASGLYDEEASTKPVLSESTFELFHTQGVEAELTSVARRILNLHRSGMPLREIGVVGRSLSPYAPYLERIFDTHAIPFVTSATQPLDRFPVAAAVRALLRTLVRGFQRDDLLALFRSTLFRYPEARRPRPDLLERWSAMAALSSGLPAWTEDLPQWLAKCLPKDAEHVSEDPRERQRFLKEAERALADQLAILGALGEEAARWRDCATRSEQVAFVMDLLARWLHGFQDGVEPDASTRAVRRILEELGDAADLRYAKRPEAGLEWLLESLEGSLAAGELPVRDEDCDGVRVLDGMQARGHAFRALFIIGFNAGAFPRTPSEDPFLPESWRRRLRTEEHRPVPLRDNVDEERLLLATWMSSAGEQLVVSYRRADENGRAEVPSFALRELARVRLGAPDPEPLLDLARRIPVHPRDRLLEWQNLPGLLSPTEASLMVALGSGNRAARVLERQQDPGSAGGVLEVALEWVRRRGDVWSAEEGCVGPVPAGMLPRSWSHSSLKDLAHCPLRFFFDRVLGVESVPEALDDSVFDPLDWGARVHGLLEAVFRTLGRESLLEAQAGELRPEERERCKELVEGAWRDQFDDLGVRISRRLPLLWEERSQRWRGALSAFVIRDLHSWRARGLDLVELEGGGTMQLPPAPGGSGTALPLYGKMDRVAQDPRGGTVIFDYKTGKKLEAEAKELEMLRGLQLQGPLYAWIEQARATRPEATISVEFLGIGPHYEEDPEAARIVLDAGDLEGLRAGIEETVRTLAGLAAEGRFPFHDQRACSWCEFELACHHREHPARRSVRNLRENADYFDLLKKSTRAPTLADVRAGGEKRAEGKA